MHFINKKIIHAALFLVVSLLAACGGGGGGTPNATATYTVSGSVSGTAVTGLKLTNNGGSEITVNSAGAFAFATPLANASAYNVQVSQNPTGPAQVCTVTGNTGVISGANITNVNVVCSVPTLSIQDITSTGPGQSPTVTFQVKMNGVPADILSTPMASLKATISGPTTDYAGYWQAKIQGSGAVGTLADVDAPNGIFQYVFPVSGAVPNTATGSYAIGLEGYVTIGGEQFSAVSPVKFFAVTDAAPAARRAIVDDAKCNACHATMAAHGGSIRGVQYCAFCHNPSLSNDTRVARFEGATIVAPSMDMKVLIHKIHRGTALTQPYTIGGFPAPTIANPVGTPIDFGAVSYPGDLRSCKACHLPNTYNIPLAPGILPSTARQFTCTELVANDNNDYCDSPFFTSTDILTPPITAVCISCHDATSTAAHAATMTTVSGVESCATCHDVGSTNGIGLYHFLTP